MKVLLTGHKAKSARWLGHSCVRQATTCVDTDFFAGCDLGAFGGEIPNIRKDIRNLTKVTKGLTRSCISQRCRLLLPRSEN